MDVELKPCPFCGSDVIHHFEHSEGHESYGLQCTRCWTTGPQFGNKLDAITAWNTRPALLRDAGDAARWRAFKYGSGKPFGTDYVVRQFSRTFGEEEPVSWHDFERAMDERIAAMHAPGGATDPQT